MANQVIKSIHYQFKLTHEIKTTWRRLEFWPHNVNQKW